MLRLYFLSYYIAEYLQFAHLSLIKIFVAKDLVFLLLKKAGLAKCITRFETHSSYNALYILTKIANDAVWFC